MLRIDLFRTHTTESEPMFTLRTAIRLLVVFAFVLFLDRGEAWAHFLFVHCVRGNDPRAELHFAESAWDFSANDRMVSLMQTNRTWLGDESPLTCTAAPFGVTAPLPDDTEVVCSEFTYGLMSRGETFLLRYHAKGTAGIEAAATPAGLEAEVLAQPREDGTLALTVLFNGEPVENAEVVVPSEGLEAKTLTTDDQGRVDMRMPQTPLFSIRAMVPETASGEHGGKPYELVRHYTTLTVHARPDVGPSDGLAWSVLHDARDRCAEFPVAGAGWNARVTGSLGDEAVEESIAYDAGTDLAMLVAPLPDPASTTAAIALAPDRTADAGSVITIPDLGRTYTIRDRRIESIEERHEGRSRRIDILDWNKTNDGRLLPVRVQIIRFGVDGGIEQVAVIDRGHDELEGVHVPDTHTGRITTGATDTTALSLRLGDIKVDGPS